LLQPFTAIAHNGLQPGFHLHAALPQALHQSFTYGLLFLVGYLPIENLSFAAAIGPQAKGNQHHDAFAALALAAILVDALLLGLHAQPDAIELHHRRYLLDRPAMHLSQLSFQLIDPLIDGAQSYACSHRGCPFLVSRCRKLRDKPLPKMARWGASSQKR
jgi:hypothetical protein